MIHMSPSTRDHFAKEYDQYGDLFERIGPTEAECSSVAQIEAENGWNDLPTTSFRPCTAYFDRLNMRALEFRFHSGRVVEKLKEGISHVIRAKKFKIVRESWVTDSIK
uniref:BRCT domain-containing protein n=1 Tax=Sinocyclocheilus grahami TaxID=75366 RepID=A0A672PCB1_SINGR